jgi:NAD(P)-dependent dehydrogenase (short-subunit alcohol dehydrogenase family)
MNVNHKVAVVIGGASGIGLALCTRFARESAHVVSSDLDQEACDWTVAFLGRGRRQRTITKQQVLARTRGLEREREHPTVAGALSAPTQSLARQA